MSMEYPCIYFEKDGKCRKFSDNTAVSYCVMGPCPEQKSSNADRIRAMSDEELAEFLAEEQFRIANVVFQAVGYGLEKQAIYVRRLDWLQQPAEEDT